jgi:8-oxo-dGTP diphosphatase
VRRISAYGLCHDNEGRVLLARADRDTWAVPGAVVGQGVNPRHTVEEAIRNQTGVNVTVDGPRDVVTAIGLDAHGSPVRQEEQLVFDAHADATPPAEKARWAGPKDIDTLQLTPRAARLLGRRDSDAEVEAWELAEPPSKFRRQRFAAYALATDPKGNVLLARVANGYPGEGKWHLPGGGTNIGEAAVSGLIRELAEETGQSGRVESVLDIASLHDKAALGPEGHPIDFHGVAAIYRVRVEKPTKPRVTDPGGSTAEAGWFTPHDALSLDLTGTARAALLKALVAGSTGR